MQAGNPQKLRTGLDRIWHAAGYSLAGLRAGWQETAFRQEAIAACVLLQLAFLVGGSWVEVALLTGTVLLVMIVELLNTCVETAIDRIGPEWNHLSKRAKDMGSAAVLLSLLLAGGVWLAALAQWLLGQGFRRRRRPCPAATCSRRGRAPGTRRTAAPHAAS